MLALKLRNNIYPSNNFWDQDRLDFLFILSDSLNPN